MAGKNGPHILLLDVETAPILGYVWSLWQQDVGLNQIKQDWFILSWAAKWLNEPEVMYEDQRTSRYIEDDKRIMKKLHKLLDKCDILITQNGKAFDAKKINARFILNGLKPTSGYRHIDTKQLAKRHFAFTSNRLEYMADKLCTKYKKLKHHKYQGFELWKECLARNLDAWNEMEKYNKHDVLALEELYLKLAPWDTSVGVNSFSDHESMKCQCGGAKFKKDGFAHNVSGKFQRYRCQRCGALYRAKQNMLSKEKRSTILVKE